MVPGNKAFYVPDGTESRPFKIAGSTLPMDPSKANKTNLMWGEVYVGHPKF